MLTDKTVEEFIDILRSDAPAPGGGSVAALCGSLSSALLQMVCNLTAGRKKYLEFEAFALETAEKAERLKDELLRLIDEDAGAYNRVSAAIAMPRETGAQKAERAAVMQEALQYAAQVPLNTMGKAEECLKLIESAAGKTNRNAASDLGVAALCVQACVRGAWLNVKINLSALKDEAFVRAANETADGILGAAVRSAEAIYAGIEKGL